MFTPISVLTDEHDKTEVAIDTFSNNVNLLSIKITHYPSKGSYAGTTNINLQFDNKEGFVKLLEQLEQAIHVARQENEI